MTLSHSLYVLVSLYVNIFVSFSGTTVVGVPHAFINNLSNSLFNALTDIVGVILAADSVNIFHSHSLIAPNVHHCFLTSKKFFNVKFFLRYATSEPTSHIQVAIANLVAVGLFTNDCFILFILVTISLANVPHHKPPHHQTPQPHHHPQPTPADTRSFPFHCLQSGYFVLPKFFISGASVAQLVCAALLIIVCISSGNDAINSSFTDQSAFLAIVAYFCISAALPISIPFSEAVIIKLFIASI
jgi:hypothetical protein